MKTHSKLAVALVATTVAATAATLPSAAQPPGALPSAALRSVTAAAAEPPTFTATQTGSFDAFDANQGIGVDRSHFYAVNNRTITKHDKRTGRALLQFAGREGGAIEHLDSAAVVGGRIYTAHSNYPEWPMESSIEVFDAGTMRHVGTHSFGIYRGSLTWLDRHAGSWWAAFANYDKVQSGQTEPYGETYNTQVVRMNRNFEVVESWTIPKQILDRFDLMSNSGGSWGPDGRLYLTGHDLPEAYVMNVPRAGGELIWVATVSLPGIEGQGIAWDDDARSGPALWGISRDNAEANRYDVPFEQIEDPATSDWKVNGPGGFER